MFGRSTGRPFSPKTEGTGFQLLTHKMDHLSGRQSKLLSDRVKCGPVFPGHLDDAVTRPIIPAIWVFGIMMIQCYSLGCSRACVRQR